MSLGYAHYFCINASPQTASLNSTFRNEYTLKHSCAWWESWKIYPRAICLRMSPAGVWVCAPQACRAAFIFPWNRPCVSQRRDHGCFVWHVIISQAMKNLGSESLANHKTARTKLASLWVSCSAHRLGSQHRTAPLSIRIGFTSQIKLYLFSKACRPECVVWNCVKYEQDHSIQSPCWFDLPDHRDHVNTVDNPCQSWMAPAECLLVWHNLLCNGWLASRLMVDNPAHTTVISWSFPPLNTQSNCL